MNILITDDEHLALRYLKRQVKNVLPDSYICTFQSSYETLSFLKENPIDIAFYDIELPEINGLELAKLTKERHPDANIIFVTAHSNYALESFSVQASDYLLKPVTIEMLKKALARLRTPLVQDHLPIYIRTFGVFEVILRGNPLVFRRSKAKELFAYLVDRKGSGVTMAELSAVLFEEGSNSVSQKSYIRTLISELNATFREHDILDILVKKHNSISVNTTKFICDSYDFLQKKAYAVNLYHGIYMSGYPWAEFTISPHSEKFP